MSKIERELSLSVLEIIEDVLPNTKLANNQKLKAVLQRCRKALEDKEGQ